MTHILALDQGTTSSRALIIDHEGQIKGMAQKEFRQIFPSPGLVEHDPDEIWSSQASVATEALTRNGFKATDIAAIGITNQRETSIVWDKISGQPIGNAIVWQDGRTSPLCERLKKEGLETLFIKKTGLRLNPYFSGTKIQWMLQNHQDAFKKAQRGELAFGTVDSWLVWKLTGGKRHVTDASNASRTLLFNIHTGQWDDELLDILQIPASMMPEVCDSSQVYGQTSLDIFSSSIPISGIAGDQQAALFGQTCFHPGMVKNTYGTGSFMLMHTGEKPIASQNQLLTTIAYRIKGKTHYALEGSVFMAGAVVQWLRDQLGVIRKSSDIQALASSVKNSGGVVFVPAFTGLGAPYWHTQAKGAILGITRGSTAAHIARAALDGIAFQVSDVLQAMSADCQEPLTKLYVDGGASADDLLMQRQADLLSVPVLRPRIKELTAMGAAYLAGLAVGFWKDEEEIARYWKLDRSFEPSISKEQAMQEMRVWRKAVEAVCMWG